MVKTSPYVISYVPSALFKDTYNGIKGFVISRQKFPLFGAISKHLELDSCLCVAGLRPV